MLLALLGMLVGATDTGIDVLPHEPPCVVTAPAEYPIDAWNAKRETDIFVEVLVARDGHVENAHASTVEPPFTDAALAAVRTWRYAPASRRRQFSVRVPFRIPDLPLHRVAPDALFEQARSLDTEARTSAWREIHDRGEALLPTIVSELADPDAAHRCTAVSAARAMGSRARGAVPRLLDLVNQGEAETSCYPGEALFRIDPETFNDAIVHAVRTRDVPRCRALVDGVSIEDHAPPALFDALKLDGCRKDAADALASATDARAAPALLRALQAPSPEGRREVVEALGSFVSRADRERLKSWTPHVVRAMTAALRDPDAAVRQGAARLLEQLGTAAAPAVDALVHALRDADPQVRWRAVRVLSELGALARTAGPALLALRRDLPAAEAKDWPIAEELERAIETTGADKEEARLPAEDEVRAAIVEYVLTREREDAAPPPGFELVVAGDPEKKGLLRALARRGVTLREGTHTRLVLGRVTWTALDLVSVPVTFDGGMDSSGTTYVVALSNGRWTVVGTRGGWITEGTTPPGSPRTASERAACHRAAPSPLRAPVARAG